MDEALGQERSLRLVPGQLQSLLVGDRSLVGAAQAAQQFCADRRQVLVSREPGVLL